MTGLNKHKKLCPQCEGEIDKDALHCLYCGSDLGTLQGTSPAVQERVAEAPSEPATASLFSLVLVLSGTLFLIYALFLLFFSTDGVLILRWDASYWFVYLFVALPLLIWGLRR